MLGIVRLGEGFGLTFLMPTGFLWGGAFVPNQSTHHESPVA